MLRTVVGNAERNAMTKHTWTPGARIAWVDGLNRERQGTCLGYVGHRKQHLAVVDDAGELLETVVEAACPVVAQPLPGTKLEQLRDKWRYGHQSGMLLLP
jgi:hypothetical protein